MSDYQIYIGPKTRFLNFFRRAFTFSFIEKILAGQLYKGRRFLWAKLVPPNYIYRKGATRKAKIHGINYLLDISNVMEHMIYFDAAPEKFDTVKEELTYAKIIFDIGANIGGTTLLFAQANPGAEIYSFEPHPVTFQKARTNIGLNGFINIRLQNLGLGDKTEPKKLYEVIETNAGMNRIMPGERQYPFTLVTITTLDAFCQEQKVSQIDFLKVDVEGYEYFVLLGGKAIITKCHPVIYLELYDHGLTLNGQSARALIDLLVGYGYDYFLNAYTSTPITMETDLTNCDIDIIAKKTTART